MTTPWNLQPGGVNLTAGEPGHSTEMPPEAPFRLLVCGNFSGNRPAAIPLSQRKPMLIDRDNFDEILAGIAPRITLRHPADGPDLAISFRELDDFEPDRLFHSLPVFEELRTLQSEIEQAATFPKAAAKIRPWATSSGAMPPPVEEQPALSGRDVLAEMLGGSVGEAAPEPPDNDWQRFLKQAVHPHLVAKTDPRKADYEKILEQAMSAQMGAILHHPSFQALEAAWRSVALLVKRLPTDATLQVYILDASRDELQADLAQDDARNSVFVRAVSEKPWAVVVSLEAIGKQMADLEVLASMALVSARERTPVLAAASTGLVGCPSLVTEPDPREWKPDAALTAAWQMIRAMPIARYIGLVIPRFLLRLPYGKDATTTESFVYEEMAPRDHEHYLWGSGAVLGALLLAEGFVAAGWEQCVGTVHQVDGLPLHVYTEGGESRVQPCAEVLLRENTLTALMEQGLMVLVSQRERDGVRLQRFQSAAQGTEPLAGRW